MRPPHPSLLAVGLVALLLGPTVRAQVNSDGVDPSTPYGQSVIQNQQYQQQEQQNEQQWRQNQADQQQRDQTFRDQQQQYYGGQGGGGQGGGGYEMPSGPFGAIYIGASAHPAVRGSFNYPSIATARAAAKSACQSVEHGICKEALAFRNTCAAVAVAPNGMWTTRTAPLDVQAADEALTACKASSKHECDLKTMYCSPNNN